MSDAHKKRFEFPSAVLQAQAVRSLVTAVLKEIDQDGKITLSSSKSPCLQTLWDECCGDSDIVRSSCCDALVLLVDQGHADLQHVINTVLNLLPSARKLQGLTHVIGKLLQIQTMQREHITRFVCPYSIRNSPHPFISVLENRPDSWTFLLPEIQRFVQRAVREKNLAYVSMLTPFLRYLYCEPLQLPDHALLRHNLLRVLLPRNGDKNEPCEVTSSLVLCLLDLLSHMQVDSVTALVELSQLAETLCGALSGTCWASHRAELALQLLCACHVAMEITGDCSMFSYLLQELIPAGGEEFPREQLILGLALLLMRASTSQQIQLLSLGVKLLPSETESCPLAAPLLILPLLQVLSCSALTDALTDSGTRDQTKSLVERLLRVVQKPVVDGTGDMTFLQQPISSWYSLVRVGVATLRCVSHDTGAAREWLHSVRSTLPHSRDVPRTVTLILSQMIIRVEGGACELELDAAALLAQSDPAQALSLLLLLMFKLERSRDAVLSHTLLYTLPKMACHKLCVPQVLHTIQMLRSSPKLCSVALRLLTALWERQDRVYPELQQMMAQMDSSTAVLGKDERWEQILSRTSSVRDVCRERPYQHAADMLLAITHTLSRYTAEDQAAPCALALQGLRELCQAEVLDIRSTWSVLSPKLMCESRVAVLRAVAELLALVPQLSVKSPEYETFQKQVVCMLWSLALSKNPEVSSSAYRALSLFPRDSHTLQHLPEQARPPAKEPTPEDEEEQVEEDVCVPGLSYIKLLLLTTLGVLPAVEVFLTSLVQQEMRDMPRGVYHSALRGATVRSDQGKAVAAIPNFMIKTYERNKQPGLKPGLAAGLLLCYELPVQTDREGRPISRFLVSRGRSYQQTLTALIHEVNIQPSEWHRSILLPQAWQGFMSRAYSAVLQGRRAELEMLQKQGKRSVEELQYEQHCAWLWARNQLTDVLKTAAKDSPVVQGNSVLALGGLAAALAKYENDLPVDAAMGVGPELLPSHTWQEMVLDTILSIISGSYRPKGQVFPWFQHRSYSGENTASAIARSCASLSLSLLAPSLAASHSERVCEVLTLLREALPGGTATDDSQAVQIHAGLAMGMFLLGLHQERMSDVSGQKMTELLMTSMEALESCCFDLSLEYNGGCVLGVGLVLSCLSRSSRSELQDHVSLTLDRLLHELQGSEGTSRMRQEALAYAVACVGVSAFSAGVTHGNQAQMMMECLRHLTEESQQSPGLALSLGLAVHGLSLCGHGQAQELQPRLLAAWIRILLAEGCPTMQRLAAISGLVALVGSESFLIQLKCESGQSPEQQNRLNEVIKAIIEIVTCSAAIGLQCNACCLLGHLHLAQVSSSYSRTAVPTDFSYLQESSMSRAIVDFITEAGQKGPESYPPRLVKAALVPLVHVGRAYQYPPINWSAVLSPLMRLNFGEEIQHHCVELAVSQSPSSQTAALFLGMWLSPPLVHTLSVGTRSHLYSSLSVWMRHVPEDKLQVHLEVLGVQCFDPQDRQRRLPLCHSLLTGVSHAMATRGHTQTCWSLLCSTTEQVFNLLPSLIQDEEVDLYVGISKCLSEMPDTEIDRIVHVTQESAEKSSFVLCYLSSVGRVPLLALNDVVAMAVGQDELLWMLSHTFYQTHLCEADNVALPRRMEWLLQLMGHMRNVAYGNVLPRSGSTKQASELLLCVFAAAVLGWSGHTLPLLMGLRACWFPWQRDPVPPGLSHRLYGERPVRWERMSQAVLALPYTLTQLLAQDAWMGERQKMIDWLCVMAEAPTVNVSHTFIPAVRAVLLALRTFPEFRKKGVWTRAYSW